MPSVAIVGSCNIDLIFRLERLPQLGESLPALGFEIAAGGKGLNQAVAAARLGAVTAMVGAVGQDVFGEMLLKVLAQEGIDHTCVQKDRKQGTGVACPLLDADGRNAIVVAPRANGHLSPKAVAAAGPILAQSDILLLQQEAPAAANLAAAQIAGRHQTMVMLNAAPARQVAPDLLRLTHVLVLNEVEAAQLSGENTGSREGVLAAAQCLHELGPAIVVITLGSDGVFFLYQGAASWAPAYSVKVVDTTGAGDAFCGGLAVALASGKGLGESVNYANACGALACTVLGAAPSMPSEDEVATFLSRRRRTRGA